MGAAEHLVGAALPGKKMPGEWTVLEQAQAVHQGSTGGFSIGYYVEHNDGTKAYMKASDISLLTDEDGAVVERMLSAAVQHTFERDILEHCHGNNMDRVVLALDYGDILMIHDGVKEPVFYLIFELAECDANSKVFQDNVSSEPTWIFHALHNVATAIKQLHSGRVAHNDVKPSNVLLYERDLQKLCDLGNAVSDEKPGPYDEYICAGDPRFAPPEVLFCTQSNAKNVTAFPGRRAGDLYLLGSICVFLMSGQMITPLILSYLKPEHRPQSCEGGWEGNLADVMPYWRAAYADAMAEVEADFSANFPDIEVKHKTQFFAAVNQLCEPDFSMRGHPQNRGRGQDQYGMERFITLFNTLRNHTVRMKNAG